MRPPVEGCKKCSSYKEAADCGRNYDFLREGLLIDEKSAESEQQRWD